jgi:hypothetical protein
MPLLINIACPTKLRRQCTGMFAINGLGDGASTNLTEITQLWPIDITFCPNFQEVIRIESKFHPGIRTEALVTHA